MSSVAYPQSAQNCLYEDLSWPASDCRIWNAEMLTNSVFALPLLSATIFAARLSPIFALLSFPATFLRIPSPSASMLQHVTNATPCCSAFSICFATAARLTAFEDHPVGALTECRLERVLELLGRAVGADRRGGPAEVRRALLDDVALDLAGLDAAADEDDLLAGWNRACRSPS